MSAADISAVKPPGSPLASYTPPTSNSPRARIRADSLYARQTAERRQSQRPGSIGYYDIEKAIGEGNFAKVKLAKHSLTGEKVT
jgi:hypothetical protein